MREAVVEQTHVLLRSGGDTYSLVLRNNNNYLQMGFQGYGAAHGTTGRTANQAQDWLPRPCPKKNLVLIIWPKQTEVGFDVTAIELHVLPVLERRQSLLRPTLFSLWSSKHPSLLLGACPQGVAPFQDGVAHHFGTRAVGEDLFLETVSPPLQERVGRCGWLRQMPAQGSRKRPQAPTRTPRQCLTPFP